MRRISVLVAVLVLVVSCWSFAACSGNQGRGARPSMVQSGEPCDAPADSGAGGDSASYYQIGACPVEADEGDMVNDND